MSAIEKTKKIVRKDIDVGLLTKRADNPNQMSDREFDLLVDNLQRTGMTDPIFVRPLEDGNYRIVGGHHRLDAALYLGFTEVPCTIVDHDDFDDDAETFQVVRMNVIRGRMDPGSFFSLYESLSKKYSDQVLQDSFGFAEEAEFRKLIAQAAKSLPSPDLQKKFKEAAKEIKTIDGIAALLNKMFTLYGDTLPHGFMVLDYGGQNSVWLEISKKTMTALNQLKDVCITEERTMDSLVGHAVQLLAAGKIPEALEKIIESTDQADVPEDIVAIPTAQNIAAHAEL